MFLPLEEDGEFLKIHETFGDGLFELCNLQSDVIRRCHPETEYVRREGPRRGPGSVLLWLRQSPRSPPAKLDSDKFGDEPGDQTGGLIESYTRLNFSITYFNALNIIYELPTVERPRIRIRLEPAIAGRVLKTQGGQNLFRHKPP